MYGVLNECFTTSYNITGPRSSVEQVWTETAEPQSQLDAVTKESQQITSQIYEWNGKLSESRAVGHNFSVPRQQYQSDIRRIGIIVDGAATARLNMENFDIDPDRKAPGFYAVDSSLAHLSEADQAHAVHS